MITEVGFPPSKLTIKRYLQCPPMIVSAGSSPVRTSHPRSASAHFMSSLLSLRCAILRLSFSSRTRRYARRHGRRVWALAGFTGTPGVASVAIQPHLPDAPLASGHFSMKRDRRFARSSTEGWFFLGSEAREHTPNRLAGLGWTEGRK